MIYTDVEFIREHMALVMVCKHDSTGITYRMSVYILHMCYVLGDRL